MSLVRTFGASIAASALAGLVSVSPVAAQTFDRPLELSGEVATLRLSEFKITSVGTAVNAAWHVAPALAVDNIRLDYAGRTRLSVDAGDLLVRYGVNALRPRGQITDGFVSHNLLMSAGLGLRF